MGKLPLMLSWGGFSSHGHGMAAPCMVVGGGCSSAGVHGATASCVVMGGYCFLYSHGWQLIELLLEQ